MVMDESPISRVVNGHQQALSSSLFLCFSHTLSLFHPYVTHTCHVYCGFLSILFLLEQCFFLQTREISISLYFSDFHISLSLFYPCDVTSKTKAQLSLSLSFFSFIIFFSYYIFFQLLQLYTIILNLLLHLVFLKIFKLLSKFTYSFYSFIVNFNSNFII